MTCHECGEEMYQTKDDKGDVVHVCDNHFVKIVVKEYTRPVMSFYTDRNGEPVWLHRVPKYKDV